jgi:hypothetical protein
MYHLLAAIYADAVFHKDSVLSHILALQLWHAKEQSI